MSAIIRDASPRDCQAIYDMIIELAVYENLQSNVQLTVDDLHNVIFNEHIAFALVAEADGKAVGYCLYFYNVSTFKGRKGIYIEDIYVRPDYRGQGFGKAMLCKIRDIAAANRCGRIEWSCLDWNTKSQDFYINMGAEKNAGWDLFRVDESGFSSFAVK